MKKFLLVLVASVACASLIPASMAMGNGRTARQDAPKQMKGVVRILNKKVSRRTLVNETKGTQTRHARPWTKKAPKEVMTESSSSAVSSSASSSAASSESSSASSTSSSASSASGN